MENNMPVVVFDFDKTLTYKDTIAGFYLACNKNVSLIWKIPYFLIFVALHIFKVIDNNKLKEKGVAIFLKGKEKNYLQSIGKNYAKSIKFNKVYTNEYLKKYPDAIISSASFKEYLQFIFDENVLFATSLNYNEQNIVIGLKENMYGNQKVVALKNKQINKIDILYTDSYSDKPLMDIASATYLIKKSSVKKK